MGARPVHANLLIYETLEAIGFGGFCIWVEIELFRAEFCYTHDYIEVLLFLMFFFVVISAPRHGFCSIF